MQETGLKKTNAYEKQHRTDFKKLQNFSTWISYPGTFVIVFNGQNFAGATGNFRNDSYGFWFFGSA